MAEAAAAESTPLRPMLITFIELKSRLAVLSESLSSFVFIVVSMMKFSSGEKTGNRLLFLFLSVLFRNFVHLRFINANFEAIFKCYFYKNRSVFSDGAHSAACWASDLVRVE